MLTTTAPAESESPPTYAFDDWVERAMMLFLIGATDGNELFDALYGGVLDEPIPERFLAQIRPGR